MKKLGFKDKVRIKLFSRILIYLAVILFTILTIFPLFWLFYSSFKTKQEVLRNFISFPDLGNLQFINYYNAFTEGKMGQAILNSTIYTAFSVFFIIIFSAMISYAFAKVENPFTKPLFSFLMMGLLITVQAVLIPLYFMSTRISNYFKYTLHLITRNNEVVSQVFLILVYIALGLPMGVYIYYQYMKGISNSLIESARIDGASNFRVFWSIILPITAPVMVTLTIVSTLASWNEFLFALVLMNGDKVKPLSVVIQSFAGKFSVAYDKQFPALVIAILPIALFYFLFNKKITTGMTSGSVKG